jgi:HK97 family phage major capsid protein
LRHTSKTFASSLQVEFTDLRSILGKDVTLARAELTKHVQEIRMTPVTDSRRGHYLAEGEWDLPGSGPRPDLVARPADGLGAGQHEDTAFFGTTTVSGGPTALMQAAGITVINAAGGNANGGTIVFTDILAVLAKAAAVKAKPPFCWFMSPRTFYQRILGMVDLQSRPITVPTATQGLYPSVQISFLGWPVFVTPFILENEAVGSGTNQSHIIFSNPKYLHCGQGESIEIAVSVERYFDFAQTAVRSVQHEDFGFAPAAGIIALVGIS